MPRHTHTHPRALSNHDVTCVLKLQLASHEFRARGDAHLITESAAHDEPGIYQAIAAEKSGSAARDYGRSMHAAQPGAETERRAAWRHSSSVDKLRFSRLVSEDTCLTGGETEVSGAENRDTEASPPPRLLPASLQVAHFSSLLHPSRFLDFCPLSVYLLCL